MIPGPTIIKECSACFKPISQATFLSSNNFGATFWTDGKDDSVTSRYLWLVKCPRCHALLWIDELEKIAEIDPWERRPRTPTHEPEELTTEELERLVETRLKEIESGEFKGPLPPADPSLDDYYAFLEQGIMDRKKAIYVRRHAWWAENDRRRNVPDKWAIKKQKPVKSEDIPLCSREIDNLSALIEMLDDSNENELFVKAEAMRELGRFDDALSVLAKLNEKTGSQAIEIIKSLCEKRNCYVQEMHFR